MRRALALLLLTGCAAPAPAAPPDGIEWIGVAPRSGTRALLEAAARPAAGVVPASFGPAAPPREASARIFHRFGFSHPIAEIRDGRGTVVLELRDGQAVQLARLPGEPAWADVDGDGAWDLRVDGRTWTWSDAEHRFVERQSVR